MICNISYFKILISICSKLVSQWWLKTYIFDMDKDAKDIFQPACLKILTVPSTLWFPIRCHKTMAHALALIYQ